MSGVDIFAALVGLFTVSCWVGVIVYGYKGMTLKHGVQATLLMAAYEVATLLVLALAVTALAYLL